MATQHIRHRGKPFQVTFHHRFSVSTYSDPFIDKPKIYISDFQQTWNLVAIIFNLYLLSCPFQSLVCSTHSQALFQVHSTQDGGVTHTNARLKEDVCPGPQLGAFHVQHPWYVQETQCLLQCHTQCMGYLQCLLCQEDPQLLLVTRFQSLVLEADDVMEVVETVPLGLSVRITGVVEEDLVNHQFPSGENR